MFRSAASLLFRRLGLALLIALAGLSQAFAWERVTVTMTAPNENQAIRYALAEALRRVNRAEDPKATPLPAELLEATRRLEGEFDPERRDPQHLRAVSDGYVRSYELQKSTPGGSSVTVEIEANVLTYDPQNPRPGARQTVVIGGFVLGPEALQLDGPVVGAEVLLTGMRDDLETSLVRSHKFSVLTRKNLASAIKEQDFISGQWADRAQTLELLQTYGGDFVVAGTIELIHVHTEITTVRATGYKSRQKSAKVSMRVTLYNVATEAVAWTGTYEQDYGWDDAALRADPSFDDDGLVARSMVIEGAERLSRQMVQEVFPLRVVEIQRDAAGGPIFLLNAGAGVYSVGDKFELVRLGKPLHDPDTGELLGHHQLAIAYLHIVLQDDRISQAQALGDGDIDLDFLDDEGHDLAQLVCRPLWAKDALSGFSKDE